MMISSVFVLLGFIGIVLSLLSNVLSFETNRRQFKTLHDQGTETHKLVNSQHDNMVARVDQLTETLTDANVAVPKNGKGGVTENVV